MVCDKYSFESKKTSIVLLLIFFVLVAVFFLILFYPQSTVVENNNLNYELYGCQADELKDSELFKDIQSGKSICFIGDSITAGSVTGGISWYQPLIPLINGNISNLSKGGWKVRDLIDHNTEIPLSDIYIIAIGINDILFPEYDNASQSPEEFVSNINELANILKCKAPHAKIYFIAPWPFIDMEESYYERGYRFRKSLKEYCTRNEYLYIDPVPEITSVIKTDGSEIYMYNEYHPNSPNGVELFSYAVLKASHDQTSSKAS